MKLLKAYSLAGPLHLYNNIICCTSIAVRATLLPIVT